MRILGGLLGFFCKRSGFSSFVLGIFVFDAKVVICVISKVGKFRSFFKNYGGKKLGSGFLIKNCYCSTGLEFCTFFIKGF